MAGRYEVGLTSGRYYVQDNISWRELASIEISDGGPGMAPYAILGKDLPGRAFLDPKLLEAIAEMFNEAAASLRSSYNTSSRRILEEEQNG